MIASSNQSGEWDYLSASGARYDFLLASRVPPPPDKSKFTPGPLELEGIDTLCFSCLALVVCVQNDPSQLWKLSCPLKISGCILTGQAWRFQWFMLML